MEKIKLLVLLLISFLISLFFSGFSTAKILSGNINKEDYLENAHVVIDGRNGGPVSNAEVSIPSKGFFTKTNSYGQFKLDASLDGPAILSVQADGYKPFSLTVNEQSVKDPLIVVITKLFNNEIVIDNSLHHLGDDKFSSSSANFYDFRSKSEGPYFFKEFYLDKVNPKETPVLSLGSIIGLDTSMAKRLAQSKSTISASSPVNIFLNSQKIGEIKINGDNQGIPLPKSLLRPNSYNTIRIETGINQAAREYTDYDDIEFMNIVLQVK